MIKTTLETVISMSGDGEPLIRSNQPVDDATTALIVAIIRPFVAFPGSRERVEAGVPIRISALFIDSILDSYSVGFTSNMSITTTRELTTTI